MKKIAIVTGASSGIGRQIAIDLSLSDFECLLVARDAERLKYVQSECKNSKVVPMDLQIPDSIQTAAQAISKIISTEKNIHLALVNNAGIIIRGSFEASPIESWNSQFQTNLFGPVLFTQLLVPMLKKQVSARILNISSTLGLKPIPETSAYSSSKAAMNSWTQSLALELADSCVTVNAICPGIIETPIQSFYETKDLELRSTVNNMQPLERVGKPSDISSLSLFLCQPNNNWITGSLFTVDGGILLV